MRTASDTYVHRESRLDLLLTLVAVAAAFVPILGMLLAGLKAVMLDDWYRTAALPAAVVLVLITIYAALWNRVMLNRILVGFVAAFIGSVGLDIVRLSGVAIGVMPDIPAAVGMMASGMMRQMMMQGQEPGPPPFGVLPWQAGMPLGVILLGFFYHLVLNGAFWGMAYTMLLGRVRWWVGPVYGVVIWLIMMVSPPFLMMGYTLFGLNHGLLPAIITFFAHVVYGGVLGLLAERWLVHETGPEGIRAWRVGHAHA
jgi:hypothetical protein